MKVLELLIGKAAYRVFCDSRKIERAIKNRDFTFVEYSLNNMNMHSSSVYLRWNALYVALLLPLFLVAFSFNFLPFLHHLQHLSPPFHALIFFSISLLFIIALILVSVLLSRGYFIGLAGFLLMFFILIFACIIQGCGVFLMGDESVWPLVTAALALLCCRIVFNSSGFMAFTTYCRDQRFSLFLRNRK